MATDKGLEDVPEGKSYPTHLHRILSTLRNVGGHANFFVGGGRAHFVPLPRQFFFS